MVAVLSLFLSMLRSCFRRPDSNIALCRPEILAPVAEVETRQNLLWS